MSTLYEVRITSVDGPQVELLVRALQPESSPLYETKRFALALLCDAPGHEKSRLADELPSEAVIAVSEGNVDPAPYITSVALDRLNEECGRYRIVMTDSTWAEHLAPCEYGSVGWDHVHDLESVLGPKA